jgi:hypothetical protein
MCGCTKVAVFFIAHFLSSVSKHHSKVRVDCIVRRNKFTVKKAVSMLFVELQTCHAFFALGGVGLFHCNDCFDSGS